MTPARAVLLAAMVLYAACLPLDAFCVDGDCDAWPGWSILAFGMLLLGATDANTMWLANPLLFLGWIMAWLSRRWAALFFGLAATALAALFLSFKHVVTNEAGIVGQITGVRVGYWMWLASMSLTVVAGVMIRPEQARQ